MPIAGFKHKKYTYVHIGDGTNNLHPRYRNDGESRGSTAENLSKLEIRCEQTEEPQRITFLNANLSLEQEYFECIRSSAGAYVNLWKLARSLGRTKSVLQEEYAANKDKW